MGEIRLSIGQINITGYLRINMREVQVPGVIVQFEVVPPPVPAIMNKVYAGLNDVVHYVDFREAPDGSSQGVLLATYVYDVKTNTLLAERRYYTADGGGAYDPVNGDSSITDPYLNGKNVTGIFRESFRYLVPVTEYSQAGDTVSWFGGIVPVSTGEVVSIEITYTVSVPAGGGEVFPSDIIQKDANFTIDNTYYGKLVEINSASAIITAIVPDPITIPEGTKLAFNTDNGSQRYLTIALGVGYCYVGQIQRDTLYMGVGESLVIIKKGNYWRKLYWSGNHLRVGEIVKGNNQPISSILERGSWQLIADYPRLFYWHVNELPAGILGAGTFAAGVPVGDNSRKWCIDMSAGKFWIPDTQGYFERITDTVGSNDPDRSAGDRKAGTSQNDGVGTFTAAIQGRQGNAAGGGGSFNIVPLKSTMTPPFTGAVEIVPNLNVAGNSSDTRPKNINRNSYIII